MKIKPSSAKLKEKAGKFNPLRAFFSKPIKETSGESGFSLIEVSVAMSIFLIAILGVFISFAFAVSYNAGNSSRAQALALLQQKVEQMRSAKFTPTVTDSSLAGGTKPADVVTAPDNNKYRIQVVVNNDPLGEGKTETTTRFKEVSVTVSLERPTPGWQAAVPATVILRRVRGN